VDVARDETVAFELAQRLRQHLVAHPADATLKIGEAQLALAVERLDHQKCPFVGNALQDLVQERLLFGRKIADCGAESCMSSPWFPDGKYRTLVAPVIENDGDF
jgi:hypothetical protein